MFGNNKLFVLIFVLASFVFFSNEVKAIDDVGTLPALPEGGTIPLHQPCYTPENECAVVVSHLWVGKNHFFLVEMNAQQPFYRIKVIFNNSVTKIFEAGSPYRKFFGVEAKELQSLVVSYIDENGDFVEPLRWVYQRSETSLHLFHSCVILNHANDVTELVFGGWDLQVHYNLKPLYQSRTDGSYRVIVTDLDTIRHYRVYVNGIWEWNYPACSFRLNVMNSYVKHETFITVVLGE